MKKIKNKMSTKRLKLSEGNRGEEQEEDKDKEDEEELEFVNEITNETISIDIVATKITCSRSMSKFIFIVGLCESGLRTQTTLIYDTINQKLTLGPSTKILRTNLAATSIGPSKILIAGGEMTATTTGITCEIFDAGEGRIYFADSMLTRRKNFQLVLLADGKTVISIGGEDVTKKYDSCELYDVERDSWRKSEARLSQPRWNHTATLMPDGRVFVFGGWYKNGPAVDAEIYDPNTDSFTLHKAKLSHRTGHTACLLPNGHLFLAGGIFATYAEAIYSIDFDDDPKYIYNHRNPVYCSALMSTGEVFAAGNQHIMIVDTKTLKARESALSGRNFPYKHLTIQKGCKSVAFANPTTNNIHK